MLSGNENPNEEMTEKEAMNKVTKRALRHAKKKSWPALKGLITRTRNQIKKGQTEERINPNVRNKKSLTLAWEVASEGKTDILLKLVEDSYIDLNIAPQRAGSYNEGETVAWWLVNEKLIDCLITLSTQCPVDLNKASACKDSPFFFDLTVAHYLIRRKRPDLLAALPHTIPVDLSLESANKKIDDTFINPTVSLAQVLLQDNHLALLSTLLLETKDMQNLAKVLFKSCGNASTLVIWYQKDPHSLEEFLEQYDLEQIDTLRQLANEKCQVSLNLLSFAQAYRLYRNTCCKLFSTTEHYPLEEIQYDLTLVFNLLADVKSLDVSPLLGHISLEFLSRPDFHGFILEKLSMFNSERRMYAEELSPENQLRLLAISHLSGNNILATSLVSEILFNKQKVEQELLTSKKRKHPDNPKENKRELKLLKGSFFDKPLPSQPDSLEKECDAMSASYQSPSKN